MFTPGFNCQKYVNSQKSALLKRILQQGKERMYLEIGGQLFDDTHAAAVLPGFDPNTKAQIIRELKTDFEIIICINTLFLSGEKGVHNQSISYRKEIERLSDKIVEYFHIKPKYILTFVSEANMAIAQEFIQQVKTTGVEVGMRYFIKGYSKDLETLLSAEGFGRDELVPLSEQLVLVTGIAAKSGKFSTCLSYLYNDRQQNILSGYSKYELFPIFNLPQNHPINLAYEAATADIGDRVMVDERDSNGAINYNRDIEAFNILNQLPKNSDDPLYKIVSPTEMGINTAKDAIINEEIIRNACYKEIIRRRNEYEMEKDYRAMEHCENLLDELEFGFKGN